MRQQERYPEKPLAERERAAAGEAAYEGLAGVHRIGRRQMPSAGGENVTGKAVDAEHARARAVGLAERAEQVAIGREADRRRDVGLHHTGERLQARGCRLRHQAHIAIAVVPVPIAVLAHTAPIR